MAERQQDHGRIRMAVPVVTGRLEQPLDFFLREIFADPIMSNGQPASLTVPFTVVGVADFDRDFTEQTPQ
jgi:hypothetical protein